MEENKTGLQISVEGVEEFTNKVEYALELLKEASAILNDASNNTHFEVVVKPNKEVSRSDFKKESSGIWISDEELDRRIKVTNRNLYLSLGALLFTLGTFIFMLLNFIN
ncbi:hypothetical protein [Peribacillus muralis]|uniref:hypothetical protein n=1 Tax=Peribacillus muralis TaxID=264697 RepID=UPI003D06379E